MLQVSKIIFQVFYDLFLENSAVMYSMGYVEKQIIKLYQVNLLRGQFALACTRLRAAYFKSNDYATSCWEVLKRITKHTF